MVMINTQTSVNVSGAINTFADVYKKLPLESDKPELKALIRLKHDLMMEEQDRLDGRTSPSPVNDAIRERAKITMGLKDVSSKDLGNAIPFN